MNRNTIIRIAIPTALYESVKGKVLNEGLEMPNPEVNQIYKTNDSEEREYKVVGVDNDYVTLNLGPMIGNVKMKKDKFQEFTKSGQHTLQQPKATSPNTSTFYIDEAKKKPSAGMTKKEKSAVVKKAKAGKDIGKKGKGFAAIEKKAEESGADNPKAVAAAAMWKSQAKKK